MSFPIWRYSYCCLCHFLSIFFGGRRGVCCFWFWSVLVECLIGFFDHVQFQVAFRWFFVDLALIPGMGFFMVAVVCQFAALVE